VIAWLAPIALFWTVSALYLGGFQLRIEGGGGLQHFIGLIATLVLYLVVYGVLHRLVLGSTGPILAALIGCVACTLLLPILSRAGFMIVGVKIRSAAHS
jgi:hypothetical protein